MYQSCKLHRYSIVFLIVIISFVSCDSRRSKSTNKVLVNGVTPEFEKYWNSEDAEITVYNLKQARYGELRQGEAVLIFKTEKFSRTRQLRLRNLKESKKENITVLEMNFSRSFSTGLSMNSSMTMVQTPVNPREGPYALKVTSSMQEWEGNLFSQLNLEANKYTVQLRSHQESEGDQNRVALLAIPEDQVWSIIKINPKNLPVGDVDMIPGLLSQQLRNTEIKALKAHAVVSKADPVEFMGLQSTLKYVIVYPTDNRTLEIFFASSFPHEIYGWKETYVDGVGMKSHKLTTTAMRKNGVKANFENFYSGAFNNMRDSLAGIQVNGGDSKTGQESKSN